MPLDSQVESATVHDRVNSHDGVAGGWGSRTRVAELEATIAQLREAMVSRQQLGVVTGILAAKLGVTPNEAWDVLVRLSQDTNVKVREVGRVIQDAYLGRLAPEDEELAALLDAKSPNGSRLLVRYDHRQR